MARLGEKSGVGPRGGAGDAESQEGTASRARCATRTKSGPELTVSGVYVLTSGIETSHRLGLDITVMVPTTGLNPGAEARQP